MSLDNLIELEIPVEVQEALDRVYTLEADGDFEAALRVYDSILTSTPELAEAYNLKGIILEQTGDKEGALEAYRSALRLNPNFDDAKQNLLDLEEDILETRYQAQRPNPLKVIVWGGVAYGVGFGLAGALSVLLMLPLNRFPLLLMLLSNSLYALSSGIGAFVIGRLSRFKNSLLLGFAGVAGGGLGWTGTAIAIRVVNMFSSSSGFYAAGSSFSSPLLRYAVIGAIIGLGLGLVQRTQRQVIRSILAGVIGFSLYALVLPISHNIAWNWPIYWYIPESAEAYLRLAVIYAFVEFVVGCVFGGFIGALFGWVVAHNPVRNLRVVEERPS